MREEIKIKEISNGFIVETDDNKAGCSCIETYFKTIEEVNTFTTEFYNKKEEAE